MCADLQVVFLFSDTLIKDESFVEDISNLLNTCEVPNLMSAGDLAGIFENIRPRAKQAGMDGNKDQLYNFFVQEVRLSCTSAPLVCIPSTPQETDLVSHAIKSWLADEAYTQCSYSHCTEIQ